MHAGRILNGPEMASSITIPEDDIHVPEDVEVVLERLFQTLQDKVGPAC